MTRKASAKTLLKRRIAERDLPIVVSRRNWAKWLHCLLLPVFLLMLAGLGYLIWQFVNIGDRAVVFGLSLFLTLLLIGMITGIDNAYSYRLTIDADGIRTYGNLAQRHFTWQEITLIGTWRNRAIVDDAPNITLGYQTRIYVDGSNNPKRLFRNLCFSGHWLPLYMELGGTDLAKLLTKAKRELEGGPNEQDYSHEDHQISG